VFYTQAKFEVSSCTHSRDMEGFQNFKSRSCDPFPTRTGLILHFFSLVPLVINIHAKFEVSSSDKAVGANAVSPWLLKKFMTC